MESDPRGEADRPPSAPGARETHCLNPFSAESRGNPYAVYEQLLQRPACWNPELRLWLFSRHADCVEVLSHPRFSRNITGARESRPEDFPSPPEALAALSAMHRQWFLLMDPPDHTRLRAVTKRALGPRMKELSLHVQATVEALLFRARQKGELDIIADLAAPLARTTLRWLVGADELDSDLYQRWALALARCGDASAPLAVREAASAATREVTQSLQASVTRRRQSRRGDVLGLLVAAQEDEQALSEEELLPTCMLLLFGGYDTSVNLIGNGVLALMEHRAQWEALCAKPSRLKGTVEELLRFDTPLQLCSRMAQEDVEVGGAAVRAGEWAWVLLGAANRDPRRFEQPDTLDIQRPDLQHIAFGHGIHQCVGAALARMEAQGVLGMLARDLPGLRLVPGAWKRRDTAVFRGLTSLPCQG
ncbi:cytochrome P450 [Myxococcus sp. CA040A]|uniref:cytochrome P450 n=1 Tax=Myxococcus sp. CA040A TaxID=2741738 RepID=UPI00157AD1AC|nr:cytochrome P450 [Myxococcus sp. CA040A]NTX06204.1 cytochrome P450 [Myxococcus sp. CA040A]